MGRNKALGDPCEAMDPALCISRLLDIRFPLNQLCSAFIIPKFPSDTCSTCACSYYCKVWALDRQPQGRLGEHCREGRWDAGWVRANLRRAGKWRRKKIQSDRAQRHTTGCVQRDCTSVGNGDARELFSRRT